MKQVTIKAFVYERDWGYGDKDYTIFSTSEMTGNTLALISPVEFTYTIPEDFNPVAQKIAALQKEKERVGAEFAARVRQIDDEIGKLTAIEYSAEVA